jgi:hypothetical protein
MVLRLASSANFFITAWVLFTTLCFASISMSAMNWDWDRVSMFCKAAETFRFYVDLVIGENVHFSRLSRSLRSGSWSISLFDFLSLVSS